MRGFWILKYENLVWFLYISLVITVFAILNNYVEKNNMYDRHKRSSLEYPQRFISYEDFVYKFESIEWENYQTGVSFVNNIPSLCSTTNGNVHKYKRSSQLKIGQIQIDYINYRMSKKDFLKAVKYLEERF